jgi:NTP pyrophosphatase (non-canonical NTP hydrolase)
VDHSCRGGLLELQDVRDRLRQFAVERDWEQFHTPKNLSMALAAEAGELLEIFQWLTDAQAAAIPTSAAELERVREECADILIYLVRLADVMGLDLLAAASEKIDRNAVKYPIELARGSARKHDQR